MSKRHPKRKKGSTKTAERNADGAIYIGLTMIGVFIVLLAVPLTGGLYWRDIGWAYVALMAVLVNLYALRAYQGGRMARWQKSLARLPMRCIGYGARGGKPLEAAHGQPDARRVLIGSLIASVIVLAILGYFVFPRHF